MNILRTSAIAALVGASLFAFGQSAGDRLVPLAKNPPKKMLLATSVGHKPSTNVVHITVGIQPGDAVGLQAYADAVSDPKNPLYRHYLTPEQVGARFGLPQSRIQRIQNYLASQGMTMQLVAKNRLAILADATVAQAESGFHTSIEKFVSGGTSKLAAGSYFSFTTPPAVPASISGDIVDVSGLENFSKPKHLNPLTPSQIRTVYSVASMYNNGMQGQKRTVAISSFDGFSLSNIALECNKFGLPVPAAGAGSNVSVIEVSGGEGQKLQASGEADLDIQATLGAAPLCTLLVYDNDVPSSDDNDPIGVYTKELDDNKADIITESYGWEFDPTTSLQAHTLHLSMTAQGITYMAASGDSGTNLDDFNYPDIDPEVLSIGGTSVTVNANGTRNSETGWNSNGGSGGGGWVPTTDTFNVRPAWQITPQFVAQPNVPSPTSVPYRLFPDMSLNADPDTGYLIFIGGQEVQIGGTSGASPTCAGSWAVCEQQLIANGALTADGNGHYRMGRLQDTIYAFNGDPTLIFDVTVGNNGSLPNGAESNAGTGWDTDTGWGAPIFSAIVNRLSGGISVKSVSVDPTSVVGASDATGTVQLSSPAPNGGQVVNLSSSLGIVQVPATVTVATGATSATFIVSSSAVSTTQSATIQASIGSSIQTTTFTVVASSVSALELAPSSVIGGNSTTATVTISPAAGQAGMTVPISISGPAQGPTSVIIPPSASSAAFTITTSGVSASTSATITAGTSGSQKSAILTITGATFSSLTVSPTAVKSGTSAQGTIALTGAAGPSGMTLTLSSNNSAATVPKSVVVPAGSSSAKFNIATTTVTANKTATITAKAGSVSKTATLTVQADTVQSLTLSSSSVIGGSGQVVTGTVTLAGPAPSSGATVTLSSSSTKGATVPGSVKVAGGATSATFTAKHLMVTAVTPVTIKATLNGTSTTALLTVNPFQVTSLLATPTTVAGGTSVSGTVTLNSVAGSAGVKVTLTSSASAAKPPASVTVAVGKSVATFTIKTTGVKTTTTAVIKAAVGSSSQTATLTITAPNLKAITIAPGSVKGSASTHVSGTVSITSVAPPGGLQVFLKSSNTLAASVPALVTIPGGATSAAFTVSHKKVTSLIATTITATLGASSGSAILSVTP